VIVAGIAPNPGTGISGVGFLSAVDKHQVYNRDGAACTDPRNPHCATGPFSGAYIPPVPVMEANRFNPGGSPAGVWKNDIGGDFWVDDPDVGSGIVGSYANNFDGYLPVRYPQAEYPNRGLYHYWDIVEVTRLQAEATLSPDCLAQGFEPPGSEADEGENVQEIVLYTDEHGEAQFQFNADDNFFQAAFDDDPQQVRCEPRELLGTATITASARYPFQPHTHAGQTSNTLVKEIRSLHDKGVVCVDKLSDAQAVLCVAFARDIAGEPILDEKVCLLAGEVDETADVLGVNVELPYPDVGPTTSRQACSRLTDDIPPEGITDLFPPDVDPPPGPGDLIGECEVPEGELDDYGFTVFKVVTVGAGDYKVDAKFEFQDIQRDCHFTFPPEQPPPTTTTTTTTTEQPPTTITTTEQPPITTIPTPQELPPLQTTPTTQTTRTTITTTRRVTTARRTTTAVKAKKKIKLRKKVKRVKRRGACIVNGRVVRPCVRGKG
jgi:hypothetical protein